MESNHVEHKRAYKREAVGGGYVDREKKKPKLDFSIRHEPPLGYRNIDFDYNIPQDQIKSK